MGIRFACHACQKSLNIKAELAGKRGVCPQCGVRFRIPSDQSALSHPVDDVVEAAAPVFTAGDATSASAAKAHNEQPAVPSAPAPPSASAPVVSSSRSLLDDPVAVWYVRPPSGGQYGPANGELLRTWISESRVTATSLVWRDGWPQWRAASEALIEFGAAAKSNGAVPTPAPMLAAPVAPAARPATPLETPGLAGDATIGTRKSKLTQRRIILVASLTALSLLLIATLIFLVQRS